ncbi:MAG: hypothetical protein AAGE65_03495 [Planctomycetota bacterium]
MAKKKTRPRKKKTSLPDVRRGAVAAFKGKRLVRFTRDVAGPPRRCRGQRIWLTYGQVRRYGYHADQLVFVSRDATQGTAT